MELGKQRGSLSRTTRRIGQRTSTGRCLRAILPFTTVRPIVPIELINSILDTRSKQRESSRDLLHQRFPGAVLMVGSERQAGMVPRRRMITTLTATAVQRQHRGLRLPRQLSQLPLHQSVGDDLEQLLNIVRLQRGGFEEDIKIMRRSVLLAYGLGYFPFLVALVPHEDAQRSLRAGTD